MEPSGLYQGGFCCLGFRSRFLFSLSLSFSPASDRSLEARVARMKGQGSSSQSRLDEIKATVERLRSLGIQYERQVQETRQLLERARLDLDRSGAALLRVVRAARVAHSWFSSGLGKNQQRKQGFKDLEVLFCECSGGPFFGVRGLSGSGGLTCCSWLFQCQIGWRAGKRTYTCLSSSLPRAFLFQAFPGVRISSCCWPRRL